MDAHMTNSSGSGITDGSGYSSSSSSSPASMEHEVWPPTPDTVTCEVNSAQPGRNGAVDTGAYGSEPVRTTYAQVHSKAERKRRDRLNQRFVELSAVIPGLKKMDNKSTILCEAMAHIKELQENIKAIEASCGNAESAELTEETKDNGFPPSSAPSSAVKRNTMPEIEARLSGSNVMAWIHCEESKGVVVRVLLEMEEGLHLTLTHTSVIPFTAGAVTITMTAKVEDGFTVSAEDILARLHSALQGHSNIVSI